MVLLDDLQIIYIDGLKEKIDLLENALLEKNNTKIIEIFHKMAGSGKTYGFPEISQLGFHAEAILKKKPNFDEATGFINQLKFIYNKYASRLKAA